MSTSSGARRTNRQQVALMAVISAFVVAYGLLRGDGWLRSIALMVASWLILFAVVYVVLLWERWEHRRR